MADDRLKVFQIYNSVKAVNSCKSFGIDPTKGVSIEILKQKETKKSNQINQMTFNVHFHYLVIFGSHPNKSKKFTASHRSSVQPKSCNTFLTLSLSRLSTIGNKDSNKTNKIKIEAIIRLEQNFLKKPVCCQAFLFYPLLVLNVCGQLNIVILQHRHHQMRCAQQKRIVGNQHWSVIFQQIAIVRIGREAWVIGRRNVKTKLMTTVHNVTNRPAKKNTIKRIIQIAQSIALLPCAFHYSVNFSRCHTTRGGVGIPPTHANNEIGDNWLFAIGKHIDQFKRKVGVGAIGRNLQRNLKFTTHSQRS